MNPFECILVAAIGNNSELGLNNQLLWHITEDLKHFKSLTAGNTVLMGRKTFESIGKPLPNRKNVVLTRGRDFSFQDVLVLHSMEEAISLCQKEKKVFIIGGAEIYTLFLPFATRMEITRVNLSPVADVFFPEWSKNQWNLTSSETIMSASGIALEFQSWERAGG